MAEQIVGTVWNEAPHRWCVQEPYGVTTVRTKRDALVLAEQAREWQQLQQAAAVWRDRQARRAHPDGRTDKAGRWHPSPDEIQTCCSRIRGPSRAFPWSLMLHCRTARHVARLYGVGERGLKSHTS